MNGTPARLLASLTLASAAAAQGTQVDWTAPANATVTLNTESSTLQIGSSTYTVKGGVFVFRNVTIPATTTIRGTGRNPLIFVLSGTMNLQGTISVRGGNGTIVNTLNSANFPSAGGVGVCGGGSGGAGSPIANDRSISGATGNGPLQYPSLGGQGGRINCANNTCGIGSAGGGGCFATAGDPHFKVAATGFLVQPLGIGGYGCNSRTTNTLPGGAAGILYFRDTNVANDFLGTAVDVYQRKIVVGELPFVVGGSGGGGGGDYATSCATGPTSNFLYDEKGGGGGAGGGAIAIIATGSIVLGSKARIDADGGHGGGGAWAGSNNKAGGGGAGAGGFVGLYTRKTIDIEVQGETYANNDYVFPISADGGIGLLGRYATPAEITAKYPPPSASLMNSKPTGGMGGMGLIQFFAPPGSANADKTNTILDDNVILRKNGTALSGAAKQRYLAWRGFPNAQGTWVDDTGNATNIGKNEGDFRPAPILLPVF